ncbi:MAG: hypothetical protein ACRD2P_11360, partial [Terriglobia bacterium]
MAFDQRTVTAKRRAANHAAAQKSTGPQTPEGKQRAAFNSFQHGAFAAHEHILRQALDRSGYDAAEFDARRDELAADWRPAGPQQALLVSDLAWLYWRRDQTRLALIESQARRAPAAQIERDQRRFNALHRSPSFDHRDYFPNGCATADACPDKFTVTTAFLDDLQSLITQRKWSDQAEGRCGYNVHTLAEFVWGRTPNTARGREFLSLWNQ